MTQKGFSILDVCSKNLNWPILMTWDWETTSEILQSLGVDGLYVQLGRVNNIRWSIRIA
mgnify:CR=1 FL=1